ncbi:MAG TPA: hypothetical protein VM778_05080 [Gemmatimonadota bacterium]|nr:hypothetical protein [Gemmatimonadota bacterium]
MSRAEPDPPPPEPAALVEGTALEGLEVLGRLGEGRRSLVYGARWHGREAALKVYKPRAIARHARRHGLPLAEFEFRQNERYHRAPGLAPFVAEPLVRVVGPRGQAFLQERLEGQLYYFYYRERGARVPSGIFPQIERIVDLAHRAGLYDVDLHAMNVMVVTGESGEPVPRLFDFNMIPFHAREGNPIGMLLRMGLLDRHWRDRRKLRRFHDFELVERKLLEYYE